MLQIPNLNTVFLVKSPSPHFLHTANAVYIHFPAHTKPEAVSILSSSPPSQCTVLPAPRPSTDILNWAPTPPIPTYEQLSKLLARYLATVWDTFAVHSARDLVSFLCLAIKLWPKFVGPVKAGKFPATDCQLLFISQRALFRDESILIPTIVAPKSEQKSITDDGGARKPVTKTPQLAYNSQILLLAAYLCSYIPARNDVSQLSAKQKRRGGAPGTVKGGGRRT